MITQYGMSKRFGLMGLATIQNKYLDGSATLNCSDVTAAAVDEEVKDMLKESYEQALTLLRENRDCLDKLAEFLIEKETITGKEFMKIFREVKGIPDPEETPNSEDSHKTAKASKETELPKVIEMPGPVVEETPDPDEKKDFFSEELTDEQSVQKDGNITVAKRRE